MLFFLNTWIAFQKGLQTIDGPKRMQILSK